jgi:hypothetical protein
MDSTGSRALIKINKEEKEQKPVFNQQKRSVFDRLPVYLQRHTLSFLVSDEIEKCKIINNFSFGPSSTESFFFECNASLLVSAATKAVRNLAHRIKVNETLAFMQKNPNILQSLPFPIKIEDRCRRPIIRNSVLEVLAALDEFDVIEAEAGAEAKPCSLIPTIFSWFNKVDDPRSCHIKNQLQRQLEETSGPRHALATKNRRDRALNEIEILINKVIGCADISNDNYDIPFENLLNLELIQDFIQTAFSRDPKDNGEEGIVWDFWQLNLDYINLLGTYVSNDHVNDKSRPNLGGWWSRKADVIDTAVCLAFLRCSQFCHLEVSAKGVAKVSAAHPPVRFDCSMGLPDLLDGIGISHYFGFYGDKFVVRVRGRARGCGFARGRVTKLLSNKNISITRYKPGYVLLPPISQKASTFSLNQH